MIVVSFNSSQTCQLTLLYFILATLNQWQEWLLDSPLNELPFICSFLCLCHDVSVVVVTNNQPSIILFVFLVSGNLDRHILFILFLLDILSSLFAADCDMNGATSSTDAIISIWRFMHESSSHLSDPSLLLENLWPSGAKQLNLL